MTEIENASMTPENPDIPVIFLAYANSYSEERRLKFLVKERQEITRVLNSVRDRCEIFSEGNTSLEYMTRNFLRPEYQGRIAVFHFGGHAGDEKLYFESITGEEEATSVTSIDNLIGGAEGLQLVFLNGCATHSLVKQLLDNGVPAIIATDSLINDDQATQLAIEFYAALAGGRTIRNSFEIAKDMVQHKMGRSFEIRVTSRSLSWDEPEGTLEAFPWGLYVKEGQTDVLDWKIPSAVKKNVLGVDLPNANWLKIAVVSLVLLAVSGLGYGLYSIGEDKDWWEKAENPNQEQKPFCKKSEFKSDENYNVLLLKMGQEEERSKLQGNIRNGLKDMETLSQRNKDRAGIEIIELDKYLGNDDKDNAAFLCDPCGADMVIWGQYEQLANSIELYLYFLTKNESGETLFLKQEAGELERNLDASIELTKKNKGHLRPLRNTILWAAGYKNYEKEPQLALPFWEKLAEDLPEKENYSLSRPAPALFCLAYAYMDLYDKDSLRVKNDGYPEAVLPHLDRAIAFDSTFQPAHYYKGEYYYSHKSLKEAVDNFEKASKLSTPTSFGTFFQNAFDAAKRFAQVGLELAQELFDSKDFEGTLINFNKIGAEPTDAKQYFRIARLNHDLRSEVDSLTALKNYNSAIQLNPNFADAHLQRGKLFQEIYRNYDSAYADFTRVIELEPENFWGYLHRGYLNMDFLKDQQAIEDYKEGIRLKEEKAIRIASNEYGNLAKLYGRRKYTSPQDSINHFPNDSAQFARYFKLANSDGRKFRKTSLGQKVVRRYDGIITTILAPVEQP